jgi:MFS family permease
MTAEPVPGLKLKLCVMMFLQFFIWGAWFEIGFSYIPGLKFESWQNGLVFGAFNIGALVAVFFSTQLADRMFAAEKFLGVSHLIGGLAIAGLAFLQLPTGPEPGKVWTATIEGPGDSPSSGTGKLPDGRTALVQNLIAEDPDERWKLTPEGKARLDAFIAATPEERTAKNLGAGLGKATTYWAAFEKNRKTYDDATPEERAAENLKDPRYTVTFVIGTADANGGRVIGDASTPLAPFWPFFVLMLIHSIFYVPTISITNAIAFNAFTNPDKEFGPVRLWGTIGWIAASWPFIFILTNWAAVPAFGSTGFGEWLGKVFDSPLAGAEAQEGKKYVFLVAGVASLVLAVFSFALPHTPPRPATGQDSLAWVKAFRLLKHPFVAVLFLVTFIDAAVHQSYFFWTFDFLAGPVGIPSNWAGATMKIGQIAEILTMLLLGWVLKSFGWRATMTVGVLGHAARFAVFAFVPEKVPVIAVIALHGICYAFFFATVYIFVDTFFPKDVRNSAQGLFNVLILGVGPFVANFLCGELKGMYTTDGKLDYTVVFSYSMFAALSAAALLVLFFHPPQKVRDVPE